MKKTIVVILLVVAALAVFATGAAVAQTPQPPTPGYGSGMGYGGGHGPMGIFAADGEEGPLHEYMVKAMAEALGISADKIPTLLSDARAKALDAAVADKVITQQQADWMKSRGAGMGQGNCNGTGQPVGSGMGRGWRGQQTNP